ncbi:hypothetical protein ACFORJ_11745 [Corynebacterium hansenii]|uniref:Glycosyltransferase RgtA/B/C/D-like domain-containing protein n=1 Tax=Corynebacterium hansenii TaxID=394964 RepID=A0ABV7ZUM4_9CORY|nr:hypothetical protein [Corynebacterium hansenii]WJY99973.1 hypothetical protein CHAN_06795 [Corynebacterium hansenii]
MSQKRTTSSWAGPAAAFLLVTALCRLFIGERLIDDAYITAAVARSMATAGVWGPTVHETAHTATSPLAVLALLPFELMRVPLPWSAAIVHGAGAAILAAGLRLGGTGPAVAVAGATALPFLPLTASSAGMDVILAVPLAVLMVAAAARGRPVAALVAMALLPLARPDAVIVAPIAAVLLWRARGFATAAKVSAAAAVPSLLWMLIGWFFLGGLVPDTFLIKTGQHWEGVDFGTGLAFLAGIFPVAWIGVAAAATGVAALARRSAVGIALLVAGAAHFAAYAALGVPPYHWYYVPSLGLLAAAGLIGLEELRARAGAAVHGVFGALGLIACAAAAPGFPPVTTNWASSAEMLDAAEDLRGVVGDRTVRVTGEIGAFAYGCGCRLIDEFTSQSAVNASFRGREAAGGAAAAIIGFSTMWRNGGDPPEADLVLVSNPVPGRPILWAWEFRSPYREHSTTYFLQPNRDGAPSQS